MVFVACGDDEESPVAKKPTNETFSIGNVEFILVYVEGGTFTMGATEEQEGDDDLGNAKPIHQVTLSDYYIGETEVTQGLWKAVMGTNPLILRATTFLWKKLFMEMLISFLPN